MPKVTKDVRVIEPVQGRSKLSTRRLLEAAGTLIAERGFDQASLAAIGSRAGYSRGLVTTRFGTKENLLSALIDRITSQWAEVDESPDHVAGLQAVLRSFDTVGEQLVTDPEPLAVLWSMTFEALRPSSQLHDRFVEFHSDVNHRIAGYLRAGIEDGSVRADVDPDLKARYVTAVLRGIAYHWLLVRDDAQTLEMFADAHRQIEAELKAPAGRGAKAKRAPR